MIIKALTNRLTSSMTIAAGVWLLCSTISSADTQTYSRAGKDLAEGTILSKANIKEVSTDSDRPDGAISGSSILYGCKTYAAVKKNDPITEAVVSAGRWDGNSEAKDSDPAWVKAQKAAEVALKADNLEEAGRQCDVAISELEALGAKNEKITDFTEMTHLLIPYSEVDIASWRKERHTRGNLEQRSLSLVDRSQKELSQSQRLLAAMKKLLPPDNFYVVTQAKDVQHKTEDLKTSENLSNMAKSMTKKADSKSDAGGKKSGKSN